MILEEASPSASRSFVAISTRRPSRSQVLRSSSFFFFFSGRPFFGMPLSFIFIVGVFSPQCAKPNLQRGVHLVEVCEQVVAELFVERGAHVLVTAREPQRLDGFEGKLAM